jgi:DNA-binding beta-propeller fold protein YncE
MGGAKQGTELSLSAVVTTVAGTGSIGSANGTGTSASFNKPFEITTDGTNLYVADSDNHLIRQIVISTGEVTTVAGTGSIGSSNGTGTGASFKHPYGITTDGGNLYVTDYANHLIRKIVISTGVVTTVAGTGSVGSSNGTGTGASFNYPTGITSDGTNLYVAEQSNHLIRKIVISTGVVTTLAGTGSVGSSNGTGTSASFCGPREITTDGINLYVAEHCNNLIRKIVISTGVVTTVAGTGSAGSSNGTGTSASFSGPLGITTDGINLYVTEYYNNLIRKIVISTGVVTTLAGTGSAGHGDGAGTSATFNRPYSITTDATNLYVSDAHNNVIRKIE